MLWRRNRLLDFKDVSFQKRTFMHIMHFKAMLSVSKIHEILHICRVHRSPILEAVSLVDAHWNISKFWDEFPIFDNFTVNFRNIFKFNVSQKLYLYICIRINGIKGTLMASLYYSSSQYMKFDNVDLRLTDYKAGIIRNLEYLRVLFWDIQVFIEINKYMFIYSC